MPWAFEILPDAEAVAVRAARVVAERAAAAVTAAGEFSLAVSGGRSPWATFALLGDKDVPWEHVTVYQVDERVAPDGDPQRNLTHLLGSLPPRAARCVRAMPVTETDLARAAAAYENMLPERLDLVHLGLGPDGHTASLVPGDPVLEVADRSVWFTEPYQGTRRMTMTYPALARAGQVLWLVTGADKSDALARLRAGDRSIPAARVEATHALVLADEAAAARF
jgi:6-phosphogluconolactonase